MSTCGTACSRPRARRPTIVDRLNQRGRGDPGRARSASQVFEAQGLIPTTSTPAALGEIVVRDRARWAEVVAKRGIAAE